MVQLCHAGMRVEEAIAGFHWTGLPEAAVDTWWMAQMLQSADRQPGN